METKLPLKQLPPEAIKEFKELYRKRFGVELSDTEASFRANNLVKLYDAVCGEPPMVVPGATGNEP